MTDNTDNASNTKKNTELTDLEHRLATTLERTLTAFEMFMDKANWGASFLDAATIRETNEAPIQAQAILREVNFRD